MIVDLGVMAFASLEKRVCALKLSPPRYYVAKGLNITIIRSAVLNYPCRSWAELGPPDV